jgi:hypothetical protein
MLASQPSNRRASRAERERRLAELEEREELRAERERRQGGLMERIPRWSPGLLKPTHLAPLCDLFDRIARGERVRALVDVPAQHGKTTTSLHGLSYLITEHPRWPLGYVTFSQRQASRKSFEALPAALASGALVGGRDRITLDEWRRPEGGGVIFTGIGGGFSGNPMRAVVFDDFFKNRIEAESEVRRDVVADWITSVAIPRLPADGSIIIPSTRWHEDDPPGRILAGKLAPGMGFVHVSLPFLGRRREDGTVEADNDGDVVLWPRQQLPDSTWVGWTVEDARARLIAVGEYDAASIYQGRPRPRGGKVFHEPHRVEAPELRGARISIGCDPAGTDGPNSNHTVLVALAHRDVVLTSASGEKRTARVSDVAGVLRLKLRPEHAAPRVLAFQRAFGVPLDIEGTRDGKDLGRALQKIEPALTIRYVQAIGDKFIRAQPPAADWNQGLIRVPLDTRGMRCTTEQDLLDFTRVVTGFTGVGGGEDDDVDALAHAHGRSRSAGVTQFSR